MARETKDNLEPLKDLLLYLVGKTTRIQKLVLAKLIFLVDYYVYLKTGHTATGIRYLRLDHGPVPANLDRAIKELHSRRAIRHRQRRIGRYQAKETSPGSRLRMQTLERPVAEVADRCVKKYAGLSSRDMEYLVYGTPLMRALVHKERDTRRVGRYIDFSDYVHFPGSYDLRARARSLAREHRRVLEALGE